MGARQAMKTSPRPLPRRAPYLAAPLTSPRPLPDGGKPRLYILRCRDGACPRLVSCPRLAGWPCPVGLVWYLARACPVGLVYLLYRRVERRLPIFPRGLPRSIIGAGRLNFRVRDGNGCFPRSEEHTSELQSRFDLVCRLL